MMREVREAKADLTIVGKTEDFKTINAADSDKEAKPSSSGLDNIPQRDKSQTTLSLKSLAKIDPNKALSQLSMKYATKKREIQKVQAELEDVSVPP